MDQSAIVCRSVEVVSPHDRVAQHGAEGHSHHGHGPGHGKGRLAMLWGISGTVVSAMGFVGLSLFDQYNHSLTELQRDIKHFHEVSGNLVKKESLQRCYERLGDCIKELQASAATRTQLEKELETAQKDRRELERDLQHVRERLANVEGRQAATPIVLGATPDKT